jgi:hypothetical protein
MRKTFEFKIQGRTLHLKSLPNSDYKRSDVPKEVCLMGKKYRVKLGWQ